MLIVAGDPGEAVASVNTNRNRYTLVGAVLAEHRCTPIITANTCTEAQNVNARKVRGDNYDGRLSGNYDGR